jgi:uncharacterized iron-regulated membrane protein
MVGTLANVRQLWLQIHRWSGLAIFAILFVAALTGCVLTFRSQIDALLNPEFLLTHSAGPALPVSELAERAQRQRPAMRVALVVTATAPGRTVVFDVQPRSPRAQLGYTQVFVEPSSGRIIGDRRLEPGWDRANLLEGVYALHVRLLMGDFGRVLMGVVSGMWLISSIVGAYLTLPRSGPFWRRWLPFWTVAWRAKLPRMLLDLHRATGLWFFVGAVALSATGLLLNFYDEVSEPAAMALSPPRFVEPPHHPKSAASPIISYGDAIARSTQQAQAEGRSLKPAAATYDADANLYRVGYSASGQRDFAGLGPVYYYVDGDTGAVARVDDPYHDSAGRKFLRALYPLHSGRMLGWATRLLIFASGLAAAAMSATGFYIWLRKRQARTAKA